MNKEISIDRIRVSMDNIVSYLAAAVTLVEARALLLKKGIVPMWKDGREMIRFHYYGWFISITNNVVRAVDRGGNKIYVTR